jgi:hypothetical protein
LAAPAPEEHQKQVAAGMSFEGLAKKTRFFFPLAWDGFWNRRKSGLRHLAIHPLYQFSSARLRRAFGNRTAPA